MSDWSEEDLLIMILAAPLAIPIAGSWGFGAWDEGREWMLERGLIASGDDVAWEIPGWNGAGVGKAHIVLLSCLVVVMLAIGTAIFRHQQKKKIDTEGWGSS